MPETTKAEFNLQLTTEQAGYLKEAIDNYIEMVKVTYTIKTFNITQFEKFKEEKPEEYTEAMSLEYEQLKEQAVQLDIAISRAAQIQILVYELLQLPLPEINKNEEDQPDQSESVQDGDGTNEQDAAVSENSEVLPTESKE